MAQSSGFIIAVGRTSRFCELGVSVKVEFRNVRAGAATSELAIFDALDIAAGPVAMVQIPFRVPSGFHCNFYAADSMLYRQALGAA